MNKFLKFGKFFTIPCCCQLFVGDGEPLFLYSRRVCEISHCKRKEWFVFAKEGRIELGWFEIYAELANHEQNRLKLESSVCKEGIASSITYAIFDLKPHNSNF